jgi:hypothetical protein
MAVGTARVDELYSGWRRSPAEPGLIISWRGKRRGEAAGGLEPFAPMGIIRPHNCSSALEPQKAPASQRGRLFFAKN